MKFLMLLMGFLAASANAAEEPSTVLLVSWDEQVAGLIDSRGYELRQCFKGAPCTSTDAYTFDLDLKQDGTVSTIRFRKPDDDQVEHALTCVSDQVIQMRFPAFDENTRGVKFILRPMSTQRIQLQR